MSIGNSEPPTRNLACKGLLAVYVFLAFYLLPMFPHGGSANELTRWATAASIVEKGSFDITWTEQLIGPNVDTAKVGNSTYSNKPPGVALLATPIYGVARLFIGPPDASNIRITWFLMKLATATVPLLLLAIWLYRNEIDELGLATLLLGTPLFGYSLLFFSHVLVAVLVYAAFRLLFDKPEHDVRREVLAGAACGLAVVSEFPAVLVVAVFGVGLLFTPDSMRRAGSFVLGGIPFLMFLLVYNQALFGSPLSFSYAHESFPEWAAVASRGLLGISFPTLDNAYLLLLSPARGLFFNSPILILGIVAFFTSTERTSLRHKVKVAAVVVTIVVLCGHGAAHGGWGFGPRYLVIIVPLLLDSFWHDRAALARVPAILKGALITISLLFSILPVLTFPFAPPEFQLPQNDFWTKMLVDYQWFVPNLANVIGFESSFWSVVPVIAALAFALGIVVIAARLRISFATGAAIGLLLTGTMMFIPGSDSAEDQFRRATIAERFFVPSGRLETYRLNAEQSSDWSTLRRINEAEWNINDTRAYAPNDFPYLQPRKLEASPSALIRSAIASQKRGDIKAAEEILSSGKSRFAFARCEFAGNLAVIYYLTAQKDKALRELESVQSMVNPASRPDCMRTQYLLGTLYRERGRDAEADAMFRNFLQNSAGTSDPELLGFRQQISKQRVQQ